MAWESPEAGEGKGPGGDRADIFEEVTGEPLEEGFTQVSRGQKGGDGLLQAEKPAWAKAWKKHSKQICASGEQIQGKGCRERRENRGRDVGI